MAYTIEIARSLLRGPIADRPLASVGRYWYFADDEDGGTLYKSDGSAWSQVASGAAGGAGVDSIAKSGDTPLTGDVTLSEGANVTLTQVGQDIEIAASGTGSTPTGTGFTHNTAGVQDAASKLVEIADVAASLKPSGTATGTDESLRRLGTGSTHAAAGDDSRFPTAGEKNALAGTSGTPGSLNKYVTDGDSRMTDARTPTAHKTSHEDGGGDEISIQGLAGTSVELANHLADATAAHAASAISIADAGGYFTGTEVEAALQELGATGMDLEIPSGTINGSNVTFTLSSAPSVPSNLLLFKNGLLQQQTVDYTLSGTTITFATAPATSSTLLAGVPITIGAVADSIPLDGWVAVSGLSYSSAAAPTFVIATSSDLSGTIPVGARIKLTQTTAKYFIVTAIDATTITVYGGTDYVLANATITTPFWSPIKTPLGFPLNPDKWTVEVTDTTLRTQTNPVNGTWYNTGSIQIVVPIGCWRVFYEVNVEIDNSGSDASIEAFVTLSTANNTESDKAFTGMTYTADAAASGKGASCHVHRENIINLAASSTRFLNHMSDSGGTGLHFQNAVSKCVIRAVCVYL